MLGYVQPFVVAHHSSGFPLWLWIFESVCGGLFIFFTSMIVSQRLRIKKARKRFDWPHTDTWSPLQRELVERLYAAIPADHKASGVERSLYEKSRRIMAYNDSGCFYYGHDANVRHWFERALVGIRSTDGKGISEEAASTP
jgi:hypothetical protein